jgi:hypothetical protein
MVVYQSQRGKCSQITGIFKEAVIIGWRCTRVSVECTITLYSLIEKWDGKLRNIPFVIWVQMHTVYYGKFSVEFVLT